MSDLRPTDCRFRLQDEGKPYPRSSCSACGRTITTGLGRECSRPSDRIAQLERDLAEATEMIRAVEAARKAALERAEAAEAERERFAAEVESVREQCAAWAGSYGKKCGEAEHLRRGLETLASTFYKADQHQDYAKHVLDAAARASLQTGEKGE